MIVVEFIQSCLLFSFLIIIDTFVLHIDFVDVTGALGVSSRHEKLMARFLSMPAFPMVFSIIWVGAN